MLASLYAGCTSAFGAAADPAAPAAAEKADAKTLEVSVLTAITGASIENRQTTNIQGPANSLPNVQINRFSNSPDSAVFTIRGIGGNDADPYVGTTTDQDLSIAAVQQTGLRSAGFKQFYRANQERRVQHFHEQLNVFVGGGT